MRKPAPRLILVGKAEEIDLIDPKVRAMMTADGLYIGGDSRTPNVIVPLVSTGGKIFSMKVDAEMDPERFLDTLTIRGPFTPAKDPGRDQWLESKHFTPGSGKHVLGCWSRKGKNTYRICCRIGSEWRIVGTGNKPSEPPVMFKEIIAP